MKIKSTFYFLSWIIFFSGDYSLGQVPNEFEGGGIRVMQLMRVENGLRRYPDALPSLLKMINEEKLTQSKYDNHMELTE